MPTNPEPTQLPLAIGWRRSSRFADLVMGPNAEAFALLQGLSRGNPAGMAPCGAQRSSPQCIYLWGAAATGKTHLLQACAGGAADSGLTVAYVPLAARRELELEAEMLGGLDRLDIVCLDDAHEVAGRADWELAIFGLYQRLVAADGYLLASSNRSPAAAGFALADLASRLGSGLVLRLRALDDVQRRHALQLHARMRGLELTGEVADFILSRFSRDLRDLVALIERLDEQALAAQRALTIPFVRGFVGAGSGRDS